MNEEKQFTNLSRRNIIKYGGGFLGTGLVAAILGSNFLFSESARSAQPTTPTSTGAESDMTPDQALEKLMAGNQRFLTNKRENPHQTPERIKEVAQSQKPFAAILGCADSRVAPEILFDRGIGDLFVVRVAGNLANLENIGSEEYAALVLGTKVLMVLGHERCGAVKAAVENEEVPDMINSLLYEIQPAVDIARKQPGDLLANAVKANVNLQVKRLQSSPVIAKLVSENKLKIVGAYYDLDEGKVTIIS